ncbi:MAG: pentapeptide repeat-containing protein [bacterium]|nr:pentapeptide repeat-containing protein [bacterium]
MNQPNWFQAIIDLLQAIIGGIAVALVIYWLDERRAERDRKLSDFRIASNWEVSSPKVSMRNFQLSDTNLSGCDLSTANLENANFRKAGLHGIKFSKANLRRTNFQATSLRGTKVNDVIAYHINFSDAQIGRETDIQEKLPVDFSGSNLFEGSFRKAKIHQALFIKTNLVGTDFTSAIVKKCDFTDADLTDSKWRRVKQVENCIWKDVKGVAEDNFPPELWKEIQRQNARPLKKRKTK